jgi:NitT/TauT family transport system substrate-binding protein
VDKPIGRQRASGFIAFALVAFGAIAPAAAQSTAVRVATVPNFDTAPVYAALQEGYFKAEGLDVTLQTSQQGGAVGLPAMAGGAFEISYTNATSMLLAMESGIDLRIIASASFTGSEPPDPAGILSRKADNLTNGKQLEGKTIGVSARLNFNWLLTRGWVKATGGDPDKVTYRELPLPQHFDALKARQVDAVMTTDPFLTAGLRDPDLAIVGWPFSTVLPHVQIGFYVTMAQTAEKRPELVDKFVDGLRKGSAWVNANVGTEPYLRLIQSYTKMEPALIASIKLPEATTDVDAASVTKIAALMRENGMLKTDIDVLAKLYKPRRSATSKGE